MAVVTYDGSAQDTRTIPQQLKRGDNGKPIRGAVIKPARVMREIIEEYNLRGLVFPKGIPLTVDDTDLIQKATTLGCFKVMVAEDEAVCEDKDWLRWAKQKKRVQVVESESNLPRAERANEADVLAPVVHDDGLADMKYHELKRLVAERGESVPPGTKKVELVEILRRLDGEAGNGDKANEGKDGGDGVEPAEDLNYDQMRDLG